MSTIRVREYSNEDLPWLKQRIKESSIFSIPHGRSISNQKVKEAAEDDFTNLFSSENKVVILIAENEALERMGLLVLNLQHRSDATGERQSFIEDLDVETRFRGTAAVGHLVRRAAQVTAEHGLPYMAAHVAQGNRRTLLKSLRLGFEIERYHFAMAVTEDGPSKLPGRSAEEKAHDTSRAERLRKRKKGKSL